MHLRKREEVDKLKTRLQICQCLCEVFTLSSNLDCSYWMHKVMSMSFLAVRFLLYLITAV